jgi:hypothetical protein
MVALIKGTHAKELGYVYAEDDAEAVKEAMKELRTLAVGYRLAPEHPFPAAFDDALTAWRCLRKHGIAAAHIAIGGDRARVYRNGVPVSGS